MNFMCSEFCRPTEKRPKGRKIVAKRGERGGARWSGRISATTPAEGAKYQGSNETGRRGYAFCEFHASLPLRLPGIVRRRLIGNFGGEKNLTNATLRRGDYHTRLHTAISSDVCKLLDSTRRFHIFAGFLQKCREIEVEGTVLVYQLLFQSFIVTCSLAHLKCSVESSSDFIVHPLWYILKYFSACRQFKKKKLRNWSKANLINLLIKINEARTGI